MAGGLSITTQQGSVLVNTGQAALVGSAVVASTGTVGATATALTGAEATGAAGTITLNRLLPLRSRKIGGGSASAILAGQVGTFSQGALTRTESFALVGRSITASQGTLLYRGQVTINWLANTESDLSGYRVYHGTTSGVYTESVQLTAPITTYQWTGLLPGFTHYFAVTAFDTSNNESAKSAQVQKTF